MNKRGALHCAVKEGQLNTVKFPFMLLMYSKLILSHLTKSVHLKMGTIRSRGITRSLLLGALDIIELSGSRLSWVGSHFSHKFGVIFEPFCSRSFGNEVIRMTWVPQLCVPDDQLSVQNKQRVTGTWSYSKQGII